MVTVMMRNYSIGSSGIGGCDALHVLGEESSQNACSQIEDGKRLAFRHPRTCPPLTRDKVNKPPDSSRSFIGAILELISAQLNVLPGIQLEDSCSLR